LATTQVIKQYGQIVSWEIKDASGVAAATADIYWWSTKGGDITPSGNDQQPDTGTWWQVKTITFIPSTAASTGAEMVQLKEKDSSGPILFRAAIIDTGAVSQTYDPPLRCRPYWGSTDGSLFTTGCFWLFHLA